MTKNTPTTQQNALAMIAKLGGLENAARTIGIVPASLKEIVDGSEKTVSKNTRQLLTRFGSIAKSELVTELTEEIDRVRSISREQIANIEEQVRELLDNPLTVYFREYRWQPNDLLGQVKKIRGGEEPSIPNLAVSMYRFCAMYELFRPAPISQGSPYHGTVQMMDGIFTTLSKVVGPDLNKSFSKYGGNTADHIRGRQPLDRTEVDWEKLERHLEYVSRMIDQTITEYSLKNFYYFAHSERFFFEEVVAKFLEQNSSRIRLAEGVEETITINHDSVTVITNLGAISFRNVHWFKHELRNLEPVK